MTNDGRMKLMPHVSKLDRFEKIRLRGVKLPLAIHLMELKKYNLQKIYV